jgi:hypothetical protein
MHQRKEGKILNSVFPPFVVEKMEKRKGYKHNYLFFHNNEAY